MRYSRVALWLLLAIFCGVVIAFGPGDGRKSMAADFGPELPPCAETPDRVEQFEQTGDQYDDQYSYDYYDYNRHYGEYTSEYDDDYEDAYADENNQHADEAETAVNDASEENYSYDYEYDCGEFGYDYRGESADESNEADYWPEDGYSYESNEPDRSDNSAAGIAVLDAIRMLVARSLNDVGEAFCSMSRHISAVDGKTAAGSGVRGHTADSGGSSRDDFSL